MTGRHIRRDGQSLLRVPRRSQSPAQAAPLGHGPLLVRPRHVPPHLLRRPRHQPREPPRASSYIILFKSYNNLYCHVPPHLLRRPSYHPRVQDSLQYTYIYIVSCRTACNIYIVSCPALRTVRSRDPRLCLQIPASAEVARRSLLIARLPDQYTQTHTHTHSHTHTHTFIYIYLCLLSRPQPIS